MRTQFEQLNVFAYYSIINVFLDMIIWCLGPFVDNSREYNVPRLYLAVATRKLCRAWLSRRGVIS
jgi:hypothetical protein